jgi:hypothetical protein
MTVQGTNCKKQAENSLEKNQLNAVCVLSVGLQPVQRALPGLPPGG